MGPIDASTVAFNADTIANGTFVKWVGQRSQSQFALVASQIASGATNPSTITSLNARLNTSTYPITDLGYGLVLLSVIGQAQAASSVSPLVSFINQSLPTMSCAIGDASIAPDAGVDEYDVSLLDCDTMLRVRAVQMLAFIETAHPNPRILMTNTLSIARFNANGALRQAAIDAYMFNTGDTPDAAAFLTSEVDASDAVFIGRPRFYGKYDASTFDNSLTTWYDAHLDQLPIVDAGSDVVLSTINCNIDGGF